jgi:NAD(P)-dependent dehydrogenase (short-subunit alcohol dehydrogenase family)
VKAAPPQSALVLGVRSKPSFNLGWEISDQLYASQRFDRVVNADIVSDHGVRGFDAMSDHDVEAIFQEVRPSVVVWSVGINRPAPVWDGGLIEDLSLSMQVNVIGMVRCLREWAHWCPRDRGTGQFVAVVSNSARIPRTGSLPYCASKAAQAMALRVAARETDNTPGWVYGYEPGLLADTPMTEEARSSFSGPLHRMKGVPSSGLDTADLARLMVFNIINAHAGLNGTLIPFDADEL